nr:thioesterase family protein [Sphingomonas sp. ID1715]
MTDHAFTRAGALIRATELAAGPWDARLQHGGAPSSLATWAAEQVPTSAPMRIARVTVDLMRPVPVADLALETTVLREGRKIQLVQVRLSNGDAEVARALVLKVRTVDQPLPASMLPPLDAPAPEQVEATGVGLRSGARNFGANFDIRRIRGGFADHGPGQVWFHQHRPLIEGEPLSPAMRAVAVADFSNGISARLPFEDLHQRRPDRQPSARAAGRVDLLGRRHLGLTRRHRLRHNPLGRPRRLFRPRHPIADP